MSDDAFLICNNQMRSCNILFSKVNILLDSPKDTGIVETMLTPVFLMFYNFFSRLFILVSFYSFAVKDFSCSS